MSIVVCTALNTETGPHIPLLQQHGFDVRHVDRAVNLFEPTHLIDQLRDCVAIVAGSEPYPRAVLETLPTLRVIARTGVGFDAIDMAAAEELGIIVATTPGVNHHAVAEHTIALLMGVARGFPGQDQRVRKGDWTRISTPRVMGCTLGLIGLGRIGQAVAWRAKGLGMNVVAYEPYPNQEFIDRWQIPLLSVNDLLAQSDYVSLHLPMSAETRHLLNRETFAQMKPGSVLINTARGPLVDEVALAEALRSGHLAGAGLDVFEVEPLSLASPLLELPNLLVSPHVAGLDHESQHDTLTMSAETIIALHNGGWPLECVRNRTLAPDSWSWAPR